MMFHKLAAPVIALSAMLMSGGIHAQEFPTRPMRMIVTVSPGGGPSLAATLLSEQMGPLLGQSMVVDHRAGGGGVPGIMEALNASADGHTLIVLDSQHWAIGPAMSPDLPYDTLRDLAPIGSVYKSVQVIVANSNFPAKDLRELISMAKAKPGSIQYGALGGGSVHQLIMESFKAAATIDLQHIPYKGGSQAIAGLLAGDVPVACAGLNNVLSAVQAGRIRILAVSASRRTKQTPDISTVAEIVGQPDFNFAGELGLFSRAGTPRATLEKIGAAFRKAGTNPDLVARAFKGGLSMDPTTPEELTDTIRADIRRYGQAVRLAGLAPGSKR
jgi:tripartite-type tricarboxylate transporter receptor subunit TctC